MGSYFLMVIEIICSEKHILEIVMAVTQHH